jgi:hypothetical protein
MGVISPTGTTMAHVSAYGGLGIPGIENASKFVVSTGIVKVVGLVTVIANVVDLLVEEPGIDPESCCMPSAGGISRRTMVPDMY